MTWRRYEVDAVIKPIRVTSDLGAGAVILDHGTVTADYAADNSAIKTQSASYDLWITDLSINVVTDPTAEIAIQPIPFVIRIYDTTDTQIRWEGTGSIPNRCHFNFNTPLKITAGHGFRTILYLGGATDLDMLTCINGFETAI